MVVACPPPPPLGLAYKRVNAEGPATLSTGKRRVDRMLARLPEVGRRGIPAPFAGIRGRPANDEGGVGRSRVQVFALGWRDRKRDKARQEHESRAGGVAGASGDTCVDVQVFPADRGRSKTIRRTPDTERAPLEHMQIGHRRAHVPVAQEILRRPDAVAVLDEGVSRTDAVVKELRNPARSPLDMLHERTGR